MEQAGRFEYGDERRWSLRLGTGADKAGADRLHPVIAGEYVGTL
jgi:hypothetical protein